MSVEFVEFSLYSFLYNISDRRSARAVNAQHANIKFKGQTGRLRFNGQCNRLENSYFSFKL